MQQRTENWVSKRYRAARTLIPYFEIIMALYLGAAVVVAGIHGHYLSMPFLMLFFIGFAYVGSLSVYQRR